MSKKKTNQAPPINQEATNICSQKQDPHQEAFYRGRDEGILIGRHRERADMRSITRAFDSLLDMIYHLSRFVRDWSDPRKEDE